MEYCPTDYTNLCAIATYYKSNKGKDNCNFSPLYNSLLNDFRQSEMRLLEFDTSVESEHIKPGGSLQAWTLFLEKCEIIALYQDKEKLHQSDRAMSFVCEEITNECIDRVFSDPEFENRFDIIVDSGIENFRDKALFFKKALHKLNVQGFYFMENLKLQDLNDIELQISDWKEYFPGCEYFFEIVENPLNNNRSPVLIVQKLAELN